MMTDRKFQQALEAADRIVRSWPTWKQNSLIVSSMSTTPTPREPIKTESRRNPVQDGQKPSQSGDSPK